MCLNGFLKSYMVVTYKQALREGYLEERLQKECVGLLKCSNPQVCGFYEKCLEDYVAAEIRDDMLRGE